jgi:hypothetical protein
MRSGLARWMHASACTLLLLPAAQALGLTVVVERLPDGAVRVDYELEAETTELVLNRVGPGAPPWTVLGDSLVLRDSRIASATGSPFSAASVRIEPSPVRGDAGAVVVALGARSSLVDLRRVLPPDEAGPVAIKLRNAFDVRERACVDEYAPDDAGRLRDTSAWFAVVSTTRDACHEAMHGGNGAQMFAEEVPAPLQLSASQQIAAAYRRLAEKLRSPLDPPPTLVLSYAPGSRGGFTMVRTGIDSVVFARLEGDSWATPTARQTTSLAFSLTTALVRSWLHGLPEEGLLGGSGAARYLAALERHSAGDDIFGEPAGRILLGEIEDCGRQIGWGISGTGVPPPGVVLACGPLIQFVYDAVARAESAGGRTIFDVWADVLARADGGPLEAKSFLATNERAHAGVAGLVYGPTADFAGIAELLRSAGIDASVGEPRDTGGAVAALLRALVRDDCDGRLGGTQIKGDRIAVNSREPCRTLPQAFELIEIEDVGALTSARAVHEAVAAACAARGRVRLTGALPAQQFELKCPAIVPELSQQLYVRDVYFLK